LIRLDANGNKLWDKSFGGTAEDRLFSLQQTFDGGFVLGGRSSSGPDGNKTSPNYGGNDYWLVKVDSNGTKFGTSPSAEPVRTGFSTSNKRLMAGSSWGVLPIRVQAARKRPRPSGGMTIVSSGSMRTGMSWQRRQTSGRNARCISSLNTCQGNRVRRSEQELSTNASSKSMPKCSASVPAVFITGKIWLIQEDFGGASLHYDDYKEVGGVKVPFTIRQEGSPNSTIKFKEIKHNLPIEDAKFDRPKRP